MQTEEIRQIIESLQAKMKAYEKSRDSLSVLFGGDGKFTDSVDYLIDELLTNTSKLIGDSDKWLSWFIYDCKWGETPMNCTINGEEFEVSSIDILLKVMEADSAK